MTNANNWPTQAECDAFYDNPRSRIDNSKPSSGWESANLVRVKPPFVIRFEGKTVTAGVLIHKKCADSLARVFQAIWDAAGHDQKVIDKWGVSNYGGAYNYRQMRGSSRLSMHSWGCAIDLDPDNNAFHDQDPHFAHVPQVVKAFEDEGWTWGGRWSGRSKDGMHFQAARVG